MENVNNIMKMVILNLMEYIHKEKKQENVKNIMKMEKFNFKENI